jgi:hypothetical protein
VLFLRNTDPPAFETLALREEVRKTLKVHVDIYWVYLANLSEERERLRQELA